MRRTKIVCTIGPASSDPEVLAEMIEAGMNVARMNFSHGEHADHKEMMDNVREVAADKGEPVAILLDTKGPEVRTGLIKDDGEVTLEKGAKFTLTTEEIEGTAEKVSVSYNNLPEDVEVGGTILIDDGLIELEIERTTETEVECTVVSGGKLSSRKGVNLPGVSVTLPALTEKDKRDIKFGIEEEVDFIAASFIRKAADVLAIRELLEEHNADEIKIIPKIENQEGVDNIDEIIDVSDGIMVARGDLGVEIPTEKVPMVQKIIISKCNREAKPVITATQMLDSMIRNPRPTRAEATDVANAIFDGTDATMLSGETAMGDYPVKSVHTMARIAVETEESARYQEQITKKHVEAHHTVTDSISYSTCETAKDLGAEAIITATRSGHTARMVSKYRPYAPIIAATPNRKIFNQLILSWGVRPVLTEGTDSTDEMIQASVQGALAAGYVQTGNLVVITAGSPAGVPGTTNLLKVHVIGEAILQGTGIGKKAATGEVCVVKTASEANEKMERDMILATSSTDKDFMPALEKAKAIIVEEGGLTSHTAIVGLNLGIPVVVGAKDAVEVLRDGDLITVDSVRGLVYKGEATIL
ncbi:pyruvate kinase [Fuchsiella alkaliacetigena]|uniref:pyruvate kinase n=1 Tax=Fuchsiella alkaliacetigena TaxID=957042 RepID=UPI00200A96D5|nr:pyruvate kinase [Fuchsiella alkaliacetigena]MCK8825768.1 pyruvate kinase [Fuchsiella alkaliacetigena]